MGVWISWKLWFNFVGELGKGLVKQVAECFFLSFGNRFLRQQAKIRNRFCNPMKTDTYLRRGLSSLFSVPYVLLLPLVSLSLAPE